MSRGNQKSQGWREEINRKRYICWLLLMSILFGCAGISVVSSAPTYGKVGVEPGQWAEYACSSTIGGWTNVSQRYRIEITGVAEPIVHFNWTEFVGDEVVEYQWLANLSSGSLYQYFVTPNLSENDPLWLGSNFRVNHTMTMRVVGVERSVAFFEIRYFDFLKQISYDVETGIMVKSLTNTKGWSWTNLTMTSNNIWTSRTPPPPPPPPSPPEDSAPTAVIVAVTVAAAAAVVTASTIAMIRRRR
jgi:hypothetical protein